MAAIVEVPGIIGTSRASFAGRMQTDYLPAWEDHVHTKRLIASMIAKKKGRLSGKTSLTSIMGSLPASAGVGRFEGDFLPTPRGTTHFNPETFPRERYTSLRWTGNVERAARGGKAAVWAEPKREDMAAARIQDGKNFCRMLYQGPAQVLATVKSYNSGTGVVTLYNRDERNAGANNRYKYGAFYLQENMAVTYVAASGGNAVPWGSPAFTNVDETRPGVHESHIVSMDLSGADPTVLVKRSSLSDTVGFHTGNPSDNAVLIPYRSRVDSVGTDDADFDSGFVGCNGLLNSIVNSTYKDYYLAVSRTLYPTMSGFVFDAAGTARPWNENFITLGVDRIANDGTGDDPDVVLMHDSVRREYIKETAGDRRFDPVLKKKGWAQLAFSAGDVPLPIMVDRDCPPGMAFILDTESFGWMVQQELSMIDEEPRFVDGKDAHEINMVASGNLVCRKPHNNAVIDDLVYSTTGLTA